MKKNRHVRNNWKDYFYLPQPTRKGFILLFSVLSLEILVLLYAYFVPAKHHAEDVSEFNADVDRFLAAANADTLTDQERTEVHSESDLANAELFPFNPNNLPDEDWKRLGFSEKQIQVIKNYESKGGKFYTKGDVQKMYCISEKEYKRIAPYIEISLGYKDPNQQSVHYGKSDSHPKTYSQRDKEFLTVDLSTADTTELEKLKGIGPVKARIIYHYREKLGGFYSINQLHEVWGMNDSLFKSLEPHLALSDSMNLKRINLNKAEMPELGKHPYIGFNLARIIVNYRKEHGIFHSVSELHKVPLVNEQLYSKIDHYLTVLSN